MTLAERLGRLARMPDSAAPVVSVYLNVRWGDERQRERTRLFLKNEIRTVGRTAGGPDLASALDWVEAQGHLAATEGQRRDVHGLALFACPAIDLRETIPVRAALQNALVVASVPVLRPLVATLNETPTALVVFVDRESARLIRVSVDGLSEEVRLESAVPGHHRRGGWAQLAQSRYQRHIEERRERHLEAVAEALDRLVEEHGIERIVIVGSQDTVAAFRQTLPRRVVDRVAGTVSGSRHEPGADLADRAAAAVRAFDERQSHAALAAVLSDAAKGHQAVSGLEGVLEALGVRRCAAPLSPARFLRRRSDL